MKIKLAILVLAVAVPLLASTASGGAPVLHTRLDIGDAPTIPLESDDLEPEHVAKSALKTLGASDDTLVQMETLRRAARHLAAMRHNGGPYSRDKILDELEFRILMHEKHGEDASRDWFLLGWFEAALVEADFVGRMGWTEEWAAESTNPLGCIDRALRGGTDDPALLLGAALVSSSAGGSTEAREKMLTRALAGSGPRLQEVIAAAFDHTSCTKSYEELLAASRKT